MHFINQFSFKDSSENENRYLVDIVMFNISFFQVVVWGLL